MTEQNGTGPGMQDGTQPMAQPYYAQSTAPQQTYQQTAYAAAPTAAVAGDASKKGSMGKTFLVAFGGALLACVIALGGFSLWQGATGSGKGSSTTIGSTTSTTINASDENTTLAEAVAEKALPSVVNIDVYTNTSSSSYYGYSTSSSGSTLTESTLGSGVVLSADGYIITNYHVIESSDALKVTIEGTEYDAEVVGTDATSDIAVIKAQGASGLTPIELGDSDDLTIGEWVMTIGSPYGLEQSVATGIVSATSRSRVMDNSSSTYGYSTGSGNLTIYPNMIQTDAAINPGNSGGALVDKDGKLIGINTLITSASGSYSGVGFAIPVNYAIDLANQIIAGETPTHAQIGVSLSSVTASNAQRYGLAVSSGAYVSAVTSGSGAESAGLQVGDIITKFDGETVTSASDLMIDARKKNPGDVVTIEYNRNGQTQTAQVTLGSDGNTTSSGSTQQNSSSSSLLNQLFGGGSSSSNSGAGA